MDLFDIYAKLTVDTSDYLKRLEDAEKAASKMAQSEAADARKYAAQKARDESRYAAQAARDEQRYAAQKARDVEKYAAHEARDERTYAENRRKEAAQLARDKAKYEAQAARDAEKYAQQAARDERKYAEQRARDAERYAQQKARAEQREAEKSAREQKRIAEQQAREEAEIHDRRIARLKSGISTLGTVAKGIGAAFVAAGAGVAAITTKTVQAYGEYEQLSGGIEKIFGDSAAIVQGYAANAFQTAQMSANDYLNLTTSFSASLVQALGGDTSAAAEMANLAISDMADNWNMMGTSAEDVQNAYQGFAKQNYEMLDNLKLGYGGTASEMARLINDAGTLGRTVDESLEGVTFADIITAIHQVQVNMQMTGTSSKEAATTIQGSVAMMKASWQNFLTGLANPDADVGALADHLMSSIEAVVTNIAPVAERVLTSLSEFFVNNAPQILEQLISMLNTMVPGLIQAIVTLLIALATAIADNIDLITDAAIQVITAVIALMANPDVLNALFNMLMTVLSLLGNAIVEYGVPAFVNAATMLVEAIVNAFAGAGTWLIEAGINLMLGMAEGISRGIRYVIDGISSFCGGIVDAVTGFFGIHSPSRVFKQYGQFLMQGLSAGIDENASDPVSSVEAVSDKVAGGFNTGDVSYGDSAAGGIHNAISASNRGNGSDSPLTIIVQSVLDGRVIGETAYNYNRQIGRALGV